MKTMKLYKFRALGSEEQFRRVADILDTKLFWCASIWAQNDPMEGFYTYEASQASEDDMDAFFRVKDRTRICSFSSAEALKEPTMWGHYASGLRGVAIEIEVATDQVEKIRYLKHPPRWKAGLGNSAIALRKNMLAVKLRPWRYECEYRHFVDSHRDCARPIGTITSVYLGAPLKEVENYSQLLKSSETLRQYERWKEALKGKALQHGYLCYTAQFALQKGTWEVRCELDMNPPRM
jgi:hypothetical protein